MILTLLICLVPQLFSVKAVVDQSTLQMVFAVFRHGYRVNDYGSTYPKDPYKNVTYYPYGWSQLNNRGKMREFNLGEKLHARYGDFLGMYTPEVIEPAATNVNRTKMSLQLVLAGLFPPEKELIWNKNLMWQPIPYNILDAKNTLIGDIPYSCPRRLDALNKFMMTPEGNLLNSRHKKWYKYIEEHTGLDIKHLMDVYMLYFGLVVEEENGYKLPGWVKPVYPDILESVAIDLYHLWNDPPEMSKLGQGFLLKTMLDASKQKIEGTLNPIGRKIMLFAAHEYTVAGLLIVFKAFDDDVPTYGSCVMVELHKINEVYGYKIYYEKHTGEPPVKITIPGCDHFCPLEKLRELLNDRIPESYDLCD